MDHERPHSLEDVAEGEARAREDGLPFVVEGELLNSLRCNGFR